MNSIQANLLICIALFVSITASFAQNDTVDSLKAQVPTQQGEKLVQTLGELSWEYKNINADSALYYSREALKVANVVKSQASKALAINVMANAYEALGNLDSAFFYHFKCLEIKQAINDTIGIADTYNNLGILYDMTSAYNTSLEYYFNALKIYEAKAVSPFKLAMAYGNIGIVYKKMKEYPLVITYYEKALKIYESENSLFGITVTKGNMSSILYQIGEHERSIQYSKEAIAGYKELGYARYIPYSRVNMAIALDSLGRYNEAELLYKMAIDDHHRYQNFYELSMAFSTLAANLLQQKKFSEAILMADSSLYYAEPSAMKEFKLNSIKIQADAFAGLGDYKRANLKLNEFISGSDSLFTQNKTKAIFELQTQYETEKKQQQIDLQRAEIERKDLAIKLNNLLLVGLVAILFIVVVIALLVRNQWKWKQAKLLEEAKLEAQREQMTAVVASQEKERKRFAEDIHDGFGQLISVLKLNVSSLGKLGTTGEAVQERQRIFDSSLKLINDMYVELRNICFNLMPQTLVKHGLQLALREFADRVNLTGSVRTSVLIYDLDTRLSDLQEISLYRIIQEVTNNILKYADATEIIIQIVKDAEELTLTIEDNGNGFDPEVLKQGKGNGWKNINARANFIKATFDFETKAGVRGTTFILNMPITVISMNVKDELEMFKNE